MRLKDVAIRVLTNVRYIPGLKRNLIPLGTLEEKGCEFKSSNGVMTVLRNSKLIMQGVKRNNLYYLEADVVNDSGPLISESYAVQNSSEANMWHRRIAHISEKGL